MDETRILALRALRELRGRLRGRAPLFDEHLGADTVNGSQEEDVIASIIGPPVSEQPSAHGRSTAAPPGEAARRQASRR
jgi:hypothetical protein